MSGISENLSALLEPIAAWFRSFNLPEPIVHWGHPVMMGIVVVVMGSFVGWTGWRGRTLMESNKEAALKGKTDHRKLAPLMTLFITLGYTGGLLSLVMQEQPILQSPHFWTGSAVVLLLWSNGLIAALGFGKDDGRLRTAHAYLGSTALALMVIHAVLGLKLGLSI
jgi:hypothetical protein